MRVERDGRPGAGGSGVVGTTGCRWAGWRQRHQRWVRLWAITLWVGLAALLVVLVLVPEFRFWMRIWLWLYALLVAWFVVARTRTVSWRLVAGLFATSLWWSMPIAVVSIWLSGRAGGARADGPRIVIVGMTEESLEPGSTGAAGVAAPGRVRRVVDWLLLGLASGLGFHAFEELARRAALAVVRSGLLDVLDRLLAGMSGADPYGPGSGHPQYGLSLLAGGPGSAEAGYAGSPCAHRAGGSHRRVRGGGMASPHPPRGRAGRGGHRLAGGRGGRAPGRVVAGGRRPRRVQRRRGHRQPSVARDRQWAAAPARHLRALRHGFSRGWLLLVLLLVAPLIDARHLRRGAIAVSEPGEMPSGSAPEVTASPGLIADQWTARLSTWRASAATPPLRRATT